jgi:hypothetical protein
MKLASLRIIFTLVAAMYSLQMFSQNIGIGVTVPDHRLHIRNASPSLLKLENSTLLDVNVRSDMYFNCGGIYTGAIKTIGASDIEARLALFTYAGANTTDLKERISILDNGLVGFDNTTPNAPLSFANLSGNKIDLYYNSATSRFGLGIQTGLLQLYTNGSGSDVAFGYGSSASFTEVMRIKGSGFVGIGTSIPTDYLSFANILGDKINLWNSGASSKYGIGLQSSLMQLYTNGSGADIAFGYGSSAAFTENMRIRGNGNVGIGNNAPTYKLDVKNSNASLLRLENATSLVGNVTTDLFFKTGTYYTGAIKTIGANASEARLGLFTNASTVASSLLERVSILDNGYVGIGTVAPAEALDVVGTSLYVGRFVNTSANCYGLYGKNLNTSNGTGIYAEGGQQGIIADATVVGTGFRFGISASASGGTTNYAGFFSGDIYTTGTYLGSDRKLKSEIHPLTNAMELINRLRPSTYQYRTDEFRQMNLPEGTQYGLVADEVKEVLPGLVKNAIQPARYENHDPTNGRKLSEEVQFNAVNYTEMIPILIAAFQEQQVIILGQNKKIEELESRLIALEKK